MFDFLEDLWSDFEDVWEDLDDWWDGLWDGRNDPDNYDEPDYRHSSSGGGWEQDKQGNWGRDDD